MGSLDHMLDPFLIFIEPTRLEEPWTALVYVDWTMDPLDDEPLLVKV